MKDEIILNKQQRQAVQHKKGPLLIIAGAGTGKTTVITERVKYLIEKKKVNPQSIFTATFTEKAAKEIAERLDVIMPLGYEEPWLGTFHSLCDRILRLEGLEIGIDPSYNIIGNVEQWILVKKHLFDFHLRYYRPLGNPSKFISAILKFFSRAQDEDIYPKELAQFAKIQLEEANTKEEKEVATKYVELANAYLTYQQLKQQESLLDFGDLISQTLVLLRKRIAIRKNYQKQFEHLLVDEFQDTNYAQFQLVKLLAPSTNNPNLFVVGDDDQAIYKFRGAAISNILEFKSKYPKAKEVVLTKNYRSTKSLLLASYKLIQNNNPDRLEMKLKIDKQLIPIRKEQGIEPKIIKLKTEVDEVEFIIKEILKLVAKRGYTYKDFAILARANAHLEPFVAGLKRAGLPYQLVGNRGLFDQQEIRNLLHFLRVISDPTNTSELYHVLHSRLAHLEEEHISSLLKSARLEQKSLWEVMKEEEHHETQTVVGIIKQFQQASASQSITKLLYSIIIDTGFIEEFTATDSLQNQLRLKNINLFFDKIKRFETDTKNPSLHDFIATLELWEEAGENPSQAVIEDIDTINLMTIHAAKGLEFAVVFIPSLISGRFPSINRSDPIQFPDELVKETLPTQNGFIQEERRLFYVAMTRAKDFLFFTFATDYGGVRERKPSGFLSELELPVTEEKENNQQTTLSLFQYTEPKAQYLSDQGKIDIKQLSYSQIDTFLACPLKYKYRYLLRVPAEPHHALSFGQTIHNTLHEFHGRQMHGNTPSRKDLLNLYQKNFIELGYESAEHKKERFESGKQAMKTYYQTFNTHLGSPKLLEKRFILNLSGIQFTGKIDRIDEIEGGVEIVDYKTGGIGDQKSVDKDKQLSIYGLATEEVFGFHVVKLSLYFVEGNLKISTTRSKQDLEREKNYLNKIIEEMKISDFPAKPGYPFPCNFCEYNRICPFAAKPKK